MGHAFNWDRLKRLQRMERQGFEYATYGLQGASTEAKARSGNTINSSEAPLVDDCLALEVETPAPTRLEVTEEAALLFALSSIRYQNKWSGEHDPADVTGHLNRLLADSRLSEAVSVIEQGESWSSRPEIPRMFFREAAKLHYLAKRISEIDDQFFKRPEEAGRWLLAQGHWSQLAAEASVLAGNPAVRRKAMKENVVAAKGRRAKPVAVVRLSKQQGSGRPKIQIDGQLSRAELVIKRREDPF